MSLFAYGRTIWCTCGSRVAAEIVQRELRQGTETRFLADSMLGKLARWLRILGFDCAHEQEIPDAQLVHKAIDQRRILLTRDRALPDEWRVAGVYVVRAEQTYDQLAEVLRCFELSDAVRLFRRCSRCNAKLEVVRPEAVVDRVPPDVLARQQELRQCGECRRVYWEGSHTRRMQRVAERLIAAA